MFVLLYTMSLSEILLLRFQKKQLLELLQNNSFNDKSWIHHETELELLKSKKKAYEEMNDKPDTIPLKKRKITSSIDTISTQIETNKQQLFNALLKTIDRQKIQDEIKSICEKEEKYMELLLIDVKEKYKLELQNELNKL